jgi:hypothetical protein
MPRLTALLVSLLLVLPVAVRAMPAPRVDCAVPDDFMVPDTPLPHLAAALASGKPVDVLAVGSGTTVGNANHTLGVPFPYRMIEALQAARPGVTFEITVRGGRTMTAEAMLPLLTEALHSRTYPLVLWQTGTVEAVRGLRPDMLMGVLQDGADAVREAGGDLVLIDPQFSRFLRANTDLDPYESVLEQMAALPGVVLFHRFDLMHAWVSAGVIDLERVHAADRERTVAMLNTCLGQALARFVLNGADLPAPP